MVEHHTSHVANEAGASSATSTTYPRGFWAPARAALGVALGLLPHAMHHIGLIAGTALLTGAFGNGVLYLVGLLLSIPMLRRIHARFGTRWAPAIGVMIFTALFALSAFVIGPAIGGETGSTTPTTPEAPATTPGDHATHH